MFTLLLILIALISRLLGPKVDKERLRKKGAAARDYCRQNGLNSRFCILVDYSLPSGLNRLFVWDFQSEKVVMSMPVAHGRGKEKGTKARPQFSNEEESWLSSLGKCRIAERYEGSFGISYRLDGLDVTNSNVRKRCIVLHAYRTVTPFAIYPLRVGRSKGCVMVSHYSMRKLDALLKNEENVLLDVFR